MKKTNQTKIKQKSHTIPLKHQGFAGNFQNLALSAYQHFTFHLRTANVFPPQVNQIMELLNLTKNFKLLQRQNKMANVWLKIHIQIDNINKHKGTALLHRDNVLFS